jgi:hypothetical protein
VKLRVFSFFGREGSTNSLFKIFPIGKVLFSPSMKYSMFYEPNGGSMMLGFYVFLRFSTVCKCGVMALCDGCKMLEIASKGMGIIKLLIGFLLGQCSFMMGHCGIISDNGAIRLWV